MSNNFRQAFTQDLLHISPHNFVDKALQLFHYQVANNAVYAQYVHALDTDIASIQNLAQISVFTD